MVDPDAMASSLATVREQAIGYGRDPASVTGALFAWVAVDRDGDRARADGVAAVSRAYGQDFGPMADRYLVLGTPNEVTARLQEYAAAGATRIIVQPACAPDVRDRMIELFAADVLPGLRYAA